MHLAITISADELRRLASELTPLRLDLGRRRSVVFGAPDLVELVEGTGIRLRGDARMTWEIAGLPLPVTLRTWQLLLAPSVVVREGAFTISFSPVLEDLDIKRVPALNRVVDAINEAVASQRGKLAWNLARALSVHKTLPRVVPSTAFEMGPSDVKLDVTRTELRIEIVLEARIAKDAPPARVPAQAAAG